nr:hypothetical protein [Tanacetum cinerariifolium]
MNSFINVTTFVFLLNLVFFIYTSRSSYNYEAKLKIDATKDSPLITDMYSKVSLDQYGGLAGRNMLSKYPFMKVLPKMWKEISICARKEKAGAVDWNSGKQNIFATSSAEAEYITSYDASKEAVWVRKFIFGHGVVPTIEDPINMYYDNTRAITIANESEITKCARLFHAKVHYLREVIEYGDIKLEKVHTDDNLADPFTKALAFSKHSEHTKNIGMLLASSLM